ncbi:hypothetical protein [Staphylococcus pseudoxylosus]|uniref:hypothetical protein n=1 Tax=Staphylococcus pseudoxylosus TaxID=2282419 RepID=UPI00384B89B0
MASLAIFASVLIGLTMLAGALSHILLGKDPVTKAMPAIVLFLLNFCVFIYYI